MLSVSFREKHLLTKTSRSRFHSQMFNHNNKYPRYKETNEQQTNFLTEKVIEHRTLHLYQRYLSFDNLNQISWNYIRSNTVHSRIDSNHLTSLLLYLIETISHLYKGNEREHATPGSHSRGYPTPQHGPRSEGEGNLYFQPAGVSVHDEWTGEARSGEEIYGEDALLPLQLLKSDGERHHTSVGGRLL